MDIVSLNKKNKDSVIKQAVESLKFGGVVIYPTETCYGVGVDATNEKAVKKLLAYKTRPEGKAISIAVSDQKMAERYVKLNSTAKSLYKNFLPGPLTVISSSRNKVADNTGNRVALGIAAEDGSLGVRIPDYPFTLELIKRFGKPITATSANRSGKKTPYSIQDIVNNTSKKRWKLVDLVINAGTLPKNPPSTVVDTRLNEERILRKGKITISSKGTTLLSSSSEKETQEIAQDVMKELVPKLKTSCVVIALQGDLGAGKTQFTKGIAKGLGITSVVSSPTFVLVKQYDFSLKQNNKVKQPTACLYHIDTWRIREASELEELGFEKMLKIGNVVVIEWLEKVRGLIENISNRENIAVVWVVIEEDKKKRKIKIAGL